jgi:hypothetical protein
VALSPRAVIPEAWRQRREPLTTFLRV